MLTHLIPVFNTAPHHLLETVHSIRSQDPHPILIVDDGSTEAGTWEAIQLIQMTVPDVTVEEIPENVGTAAALNIGHGLIKTPYTALMGSSDIAIAGKYKAQIEYLKGNPKVDVLGTSLSAFRDADPFRKVIFTLTHNLIPKPGDKKNHDRFFLCNHGTVIYKNESVAKVGGYNEKFRRGQDVELWQRMSKAGAVFRNLPQNVYLWRR